jgi:sec-independent protein translocase protein TatA
MHQPILAIFGGIGVPELILILAIVLVVFGAGKLPQIGDALGRGIRNFKRSSSGQDDVEDVTPPKKSLPRAGERAADAELVSRDAAPSKSGRDEG